MSTRLEQSVHVRALGAPSISLGRDARTIVTQPRRVALFVYLLLAEPRGAHSRDALAALLWPEATETQARKALRNALHALRDTLGKNVLLTSGHDLVGVDPTRVECDVLRLERDLDGGRVADALGGYGELLLGFHVSGAPAFERWVDGVRAGLRTRVLHAALARADECEASGDSGRALELVRAARRIDPESESLLRRHMALSAAHGDMAEALRAHRELMSRLREEYGAAPAPATTALVDQLIRRAARHARPARQESDTYVLFVRATFLFLRAMHPGGRAEDLHQSRELFEHVLAHDPECAPAIAGLSNYYAVCAARNILRPFQEHFGTAITLSQRALELDDTLAIPHVHFGVQAMYLESDWERANREFECAVALDPTYAEARRFFGICLGARGGRNGWIRELRQAVRIEPQIPSMRNSLAAALFATGRGDDAAVELKAALFVEPGYRAARERLVRVHERAGRFADAVAERAFTGPAEFAARFGDAFASGGAAGYLREREMELRASIAALEQRPRASSDDAGDLFNPLELRLALAHAELGEWEEALAWEERASARRPGLRRWFEGRPELDSVRQRTSSRARRTF